ncbi:MAG: hypothetical protein Ta2F_01400 [Termitinemataceae bacterium]|nr:MAG: hypothetical protein Ta2F_01400 [Termitinemataceae bacterium]
MINMKNELLQQFKLWFKKENTVSLPLRTPSVKGFCTFLKTNPLLVTAVSFTLLYCYGLKMFDVSTGIDTNHFMIDRYGMSYGYAFGFSSGRWVSPVMQHFMDILKYANPYGNFIVGCAIFWITSISASYIMSLFLNTPQDKQDLRFIPFSLLIMTSSVWSEIFAFHLGIITFAFSVLLTIYTVFYIFYAFLNYKPWVLAACFFSMTVMIGIYEETIFVFLIYTFAVFMVIQLNTNEKPMTYNLLVPKIIIMLGASYLASLAIAQIPIKYFGLPYMDYKSKFLTWHTLGIKSSFKNIVNYFFNFTLGKNALTTVHYFLPFAAMFVPLIIYLAITKIHKHQRFFFILAGIFVPVFAVITPIIGASFPPWRSMWTVPFSTAIMFLFPAIYFKKVFATLLTVVAMTCVVYQAQVASALYYADHRRFEDDKHLAYELDRLIEPLQDEDKTIPVAIIGKHRTSKYFKTNFLEGEYLGRSFFGFPGSYQNATGDGLAFVHQMGMAYTYADKKQMEAALKELSANPRPSYPNPECAIKIEMPIDTAAIEEQEKKLEEVKLKLSEQRALDENQNIPNADLTKLIAEQKAIETAIEKLNKVKQVIVIHLSDDLVGF